MPTSSKLIEVKNATVFRGQAKVFEDFSLEIARRQNTVILGPNGAGKTTFLKLLTRELYPASQTGSYVRILGHERWNVFELRDQLGVVSHELQVQYQREVRGMSDAGEGQASRGSGALPGFVDIIVELRRFNPSQRDDTRRVLTTYSRFEESHPEKVIDLTDDGYIDCGSKHDAARADRSVDIRSPPMLRPG